MARTNSTPPERTAVDWANIHLLTDDKIAQLPMHVPEAMHELARRFKAADALARGPKPAVARVGDDGEWTAVRRTYGSHIHRMMMSDSCVKYKRLTYAQASHCGRRPTSDNQCL